MARRWICSFGLPQTGDGQTDSGSETQDQSPAAGRWFQGLGYARRGVVNPPKGIRNLPGSPTTKVLSERFWVRLTVLPSADESLWFQYDSVHGNESIWTVILTSTGGLTVYQGYGGLDQAFIGTATATLTIGTWTKVDIVSYLNATQDQLWLRLSSGPGTSPTSDNFLGSVSNNHSLSNGANINYSQLGLDSVGGQTGKGLQCDYADWIADDVGAVTAATPAVPIFHADSYVSAVQGIANGAVSPFPAGTSYQQLSQIPPYNLGSSNITLNDAAALSIQMAAFRQVFGVGTPISAMVLAFNITGAGAGNWKLQLYQNSAAVGSAQTLAMGASAWGSVLLQGTGGLDPNGVYEIQLTNNTGGSGQVVAVVGAVEVISSTTPVAPTNNPAIAAATGSYVGNGGGQSISTGLATRTRWLFIAPATASDDTGGVIWWDQMLAAQNRYQQQIRADRSPFFRNVQMAGTTFSVAGTDVNVNANGKTYYWVVLSDEQGKSLTTGLQAFLGVIDPATRSLTFDGFAAKALWAQLQYYLGGSSNGAVFRGPGHTNGNSSPFNGAQITNGIKSLSTGSATIGAFLVAVGSAAAPGPAFIGFRTDQFLNVNVFDIVTFTGNGAGARNISVALSGATPVWEMVVPHNGTSYFRFPAAYGAGLAVAMTGGGTASNKIAGESANTVQVGSDLNSTGVVYEVMAIAAATDSGVKAATNPCTSFT